MQNLLTAVGNFETSGLENYDLVCKESSCSNLWMVVDFPQPLPGFYQV